MTAGGVGPVTPNLGASPAATVVDGDFTLTIDFLTRRVRTLIRKVGSQPATEAQQREGKELWGRLEALKRESAKYHG